MRSRNTGLTDEGIGIVVGIIFFVFVFFVIYNIIYNKRRKDVISKYCKQNGLNYIETSESIIGCEEKFDIMLCGKDQRLDHIMSGKKGEYEFQIFDFYYTLEKLSQRNPLVTYNEEIGETICFIRKKGGKNFAHLYMLEKGVLGSDVDFLPKVEGIKNFEYPLVDEGYTEEFATLVVKSINENEIKSFFNSQRISSLTNCFADISPDEFNYIYEAKNDSMLVASLGILSVEQRLQLLNTGVKVYEAL